MHLATRERTAARTAQSPLRQREREWGEVILPELVNGFCAFFSREHIVDDSKAVLVEEVSEFSVFGVAEAATTRTVVSVARSMCAPGPPPSSQRERTSTVCTLAMLVRTFWCTRLDPAGSQASCTPARTPPSSALSFWSLGHGPGTDFAADTEERWAPGAGAQRGGEREREGREGARATCRPSADSHAQDLLILSASSSSMPGPAQGQAGGDGGHRPRPEKRDHERAREDVEGGTPGGKRQKTLYAGRPSGGHGYQPDNDSSGVHVARMIATCTPASHVKEEPAKPSGHGHAVPRRERPLWQAQLHEDIPVGMCKINLDDIVHTLQGGLLREGSSSRSIRVFISSTFTDTASERNTLLQDVFPYLDEYARKHGYHFQGSEMRWGIREHASKENMTADMCLDEIRDCQASGGVNFVLLSTQKYGYRPLPRRIHQPIFEEIIKCADARGASALSSCYRLDTNALAPEYVFDAGHISPQSWAQTEAELCETLQTCAQRAWPDLDIRDPSCTHPARDFFISVTEMEVHQGLIQRADRDRKCLVFTRTITDLATVAEGANAAGASGMVSDYIDMLNGTVHREGQDRLAWCKEVLIPSVYTLDRQNHSVITDQNMHVRMCGPRGGERP